MKINIYILLIILVLASCQKKSNTQTAIELNSKAVTLIMSQKYDSALVLLDSSIVADKKFSNAYANKITIYRKLKEYDKALKEAEKLMKLRPDFAENLTFIGILYEEKGKSGKALQFYLRSIELYNKRILSNTDLKIQETNKLNRAFLLILSGKEDAGKNELINLKKSGLDSLYINNFLKMSKEEVFHQLLNQY